MAVGWLEEGKLFVGTHGLHVECSDFCIGCMNVLLVHRQAVMMAEEESVDWRKLI